MYESLLRPVLFSFEPERVHEFFTSVGEFLGEHAFGRAAVSAVCQYRHPSLETDVAGLSFKNPIGLGAGFDKDVRLTNIMPSVGFGHIEVGAVTRYPCAGNPGKHLVRLPRDEALIVHYGLKNRGAEAVAACVGNHSFRFPVGLNIAKTNRGDVRGERSIMDYIETYRLLGGKFSYVTLNVSCPNAQDGCQFQSPTLLDSLLRAFSTEQIYGPVFLKISNHLSDDEVDEVLAVVQRYSFITGFVIANLSKRRDTLSLSSLPQELDVLPFGGVSGRPIFERTVHLIRHVYMRTNGKYVIIGLGGVFSAQDAYRMIRSGASLVQLVTSLVYRGPRVVSDINRGLVALLHKDGLTDIGSARAADL